MLKFGAGKGEEKSFLKVSKYKLALTCEFCCQSCTTWVVWKTFKLRI